MGHTGRGRAQGAERPMGTATDGGKGFEGRAAVSGDRPVGAASCRQQHTRVSCQIPQLQPRTPPELTVANEQVVPKTLRQALVQHYIVTDQLLWNPPPPPAQHTHSATP